MVIHYMIAGFRLYEEPHVDDIEESNRKRGSHKLLAGLDLLSLLIYMYVPPPQRSHFGGGDRDISTIPRPDISGERAGLLMDEDKFVISSDCGWSTRRSRHGNGRGARGLGFRGGRAWDLLLPWAVYTRGRVGR